MSAPSRSGSRRSAWRCPYSDLSVVSVAAALSGRPAATGLIPAGQFPREMALAPGGQTLLVSNFASDQLEAVSVPSIPVPTG